MIVSRTSERMNRIKNRGGILEGEYLPTVLEIMNAVRMQGDAALCAYTAKFDRFEANPDSIEVLPSAMKKAYDELEPALKESLELAAANVRAFHEKQREHTWFDESADGTILGQKVTPLDRVGVYVPGGKAVYPSSVIMNVMPAKVAGVKEIIMVSPAVDGVMNPIVLAAAYIAGVDRVFRIGGAQAVAALAYGTESVPSVDKIVGPGNIYVALAKKMAFGAVDIDMIAGPSEILIIADENAPASYVAADMLSQAEHDELASAIAVVTSKKQAHDIEAELDRQVAELAKSTIARSALDNFGAIIVVDDLLEACDVANELAPEHLELCIAQPMEYLRHIRHAGAIFLGYHTPEPIGDYFAGPNHVLPTGGTARFFSPLGTYDFMKRSSIIYYSKERFDADADHVMRLAGFEELEGHKNSVGVRRSGK